jgi:hypothetical protein
MVETKQATALRKRQQIEKANRSMFAWVAGASVIVAFAIVAAQFMIQQGLFNEKVLNEKRVTDGTLSENLEAVDGLKEGVNVLLANEDLEAARAKSDDSNLQVVLDALPSDLDSLNLGTSLQSVILSGNVQRIDSLTVDAGFGEGEAVQDASTVGASGPVEIPFRFTVNGNFSQIRDAFRSLERSIRPIRVVSAGIEGSDNNLTATVEAVTYYQPAKTIELQEKTVAP